MTKQQQTILTALAAALGLDMPKAKPVKLAQSKSNVDAKTDARLQRISAIARGFKRRGIQVTFDDATGRFNNVKPFKVWMADGRVVRKGQKGVRGLFHVSQTDALPVQPKADLPADVQVGQVVSFPA